MHAMFDNQCAYNIWQSAKQTFGEDLCGQVFQFQVGDNLFEQVVYLLYCTKLALSNIACMSVLECQTLSTGIRVQFCCVNDMITGLSSSTHSPS